MKNGSTVIMPSDKALTVTEITRQIKFSLEAKFPRVWIQGEISNFKQHASGHLYFTLKDEGAQLSVVMWRSRSLYLNFPIEDGMKVIARGSITVYPPRGNYQLDVEQIQPLGLGELQIAFERLKQKLANEGLFDPAHKKPIPQYPERIGIITSETGAAIQDMRSVLSRRNPAVEVILLPVRVQGLGAAEEIAEAIYMMNKYGRIDVIIIGRGGGSLEDLWAFNEENVARAIYDSKIPIISAVGHEIDFSISDFVADLRAPTPSAAAELAVRNRLDILAEINNLCYTMKEILDGRLNDFYVSLQNIMSSYVFNRPRDIIREYAQRIDDIERNIESSYKHLVQIMKNNCASLRARLYALNPNNVLKRGFAIVRKDRKIMTRAKQLHKDDKADIQFFDGEIAVKVEKES